jgi:predicted DsbA family dithiol-disulfide isomerase
MLLHVDVISDVVCPWCYISKRRLEKAVAALEGQHEVRVRWLPFQLNPAMPKEGISRRDYRTAKFGSRERSLELDARVIEVGTSEGIRFAFDRIERTPNTLDAHRLIWLGDKEGDQGAVVEALFRAFFTEGRDIGNHQTLLDVAAEAGLDRGRAEAVLNGDGGLVAIKEADAQARGFGSRACRSSSSTAGSRWPVRSSPMRFLGRSARRLLRSRGRTRKRRLERASVRH